MADYYGQVKDNDSGAPIQGATVTIFANGQAMFRKATNSNGNFTFLGISPGDTIEFSSVGYKTYSTPLTEYQHEWQLEKKYGEMDPVVLPPGHRKKTNWTLYALLALFAVVVSKK